MVLKQKAIPKLFVRPIWERTDFFSQELFMSAKIAI